MEINENHSKYIDSGSGGLSRVAGCWSLERSEASPKSDGIGPRGRRRRPRSQKHARNVFSMAIGGPESIWVWSPKKCHILKKSSISLKYEGHLCDRSQMLTATCMPLRFCNIRSTVPAETI